MFVKRKIVEASCFAAIGSRLLSIVRERGAEIFCEAGADGGGRVREREVGCVLLDERDERPRVVCRDREVVRRAARCRRIAVCRRSRRSTRLVEDADERLAVALPTSSSMRSGQR